MKHTPATPLPFMAQICSVKYVDHGDWHTIARCRERKFTLDANIANAAYIAHAANAYPRLVEALQHVNAELHGTKLGNDVSALLEEFGEEQ